jgi:hypothetical protein
MKRIFFIVSAAVIGTVAVLTVAGWSHELVQADKRATEYMRENHPTVAHAAQDLGSKVRQATGSDAR